MPESKCIGLIDLGSNAIRWEIAELRGPGYQRLERERVPLRIGDQVFSQGHISEDRIRDVAEVFVAFAGRCRGRDVAQVLAVGTAATREATNAARLQEAIARSSGIRLEIISGEEECKLLLRAVASTMDLQHGRSLLADMGGGSIEVACLEAGSISSLCSHPLGALRFDLASDLRGKERIAELERALHERGQSLIEQVSDMKIDRYIAIGGNLDSIRSILESR
ncbi:MAG: Ppx/GppA phosphatase family protein, partial [Planctomycetota bacterium]